MSTDSVDLTPRPPLPQGEGEPEDSLAPLADAAATLGVPITASQLVTFARLRDLLIEWNAHVNLTAITDPGEIVTRHFLDSLTCALAVPAERRAASLRVLDVGSGAGFPALPLAIAFPHWRVTALEATAKKVRFMEAACAELGLRNVRPLAGRAEEVARKLGQRGRYDLVTARAVAALPTLLEYCCPFARVGGLCLFPKKGQLAEEIAAGRRAAHTLAAHLLDPVFVAVPPLDDGRVLLVSRQERPCHAEYP
ncbi:MAG: 16S rRNA (guanine(527)-N(7))-methyltransferase RsmG, partial [Ktedonobacterales bacterium]